MHGRNDTAIKGLFQHLFIQVSGLGSGPGFSLSGAFPYTGTIQTDLGRTFTLPQRIMIVENTLVH